jgi:glyoxylase-like metal-dependent hydrolase (beta-lactamase superfamily II)
VAVIDPGPNVEEHVRPLSDLLAGASKIQILLTHGHGDHAGAARGLMDRTGAVVLGPPSTGFEPLEGGEEIDTDWGKLVAVSTPGHSRDHLVFHWPAGDAVFVGDLILGKGDTTWLGEYPGCVADYLASLERVGVLSPSILYPAHGPPVKNPVEALDRFRRHRMDRLRQLGEVLDRAPNATPDEVLEAVYGRELPARLRKAALASVEVMLHHLESAT